ncbi:cytidylyltransferase domain-containing protein [Curtobacterium luteum]|uniref:acylneuraminate cytidylyltransferase family protein n=1 Tax=Curtobacterium luteum TaxID=33881 RepID=UPI0007377B83|nr:acylneuraminate cytidylyltransferase family protein [Curtobacterium luteum]
MSSIGRVLAVVPARAGSKGIPGKNLRQVGGRSLVARAVDAALATPSIDTVVVSTDGPDIADEARAAGARVLHRPADLAGDTASSESALLHVLDVLEQIHEEVPEVLVFLQATSPFTDPADLEAAVHRVLSGAADVVFAAVPSHAFLWRVDGDGQARAVNHDASVRPRRQDRAPEFRETGAFYVLRVDGFRQHRHRFFGRTELTAIDAATAVDVDDETDLTVAQALAATLVPAPNGAP